jgi:Zn-dependent metalloprotease
MVCGNIHTLNPQFSCFIIPPNVLQKIVENGSEKQKKDAERNIQSIISIRGRRLSLLRQTALLGQTLLATVLQTQLDRLIYDAKGDSSLPGELKRKEGQGSVGSNDIDKAYDYSGDAYRLFKEAFERNSIDNSGMSLVSSVNYIEPGEEFYNNASWNGEQMIYGVPDPSVFKTFLLRTVASHEMGHGVVQHEGGLRYQKDTGALNEHFADVFGILAEQRILAEQLNKNQDADQSNWLIGEGIWADNVNGKALRSMSDPGTAYDDPLIGKDPQPKHMDNYINLPVDPFNDWGGVHINSGIPNHAFYKAAKNLGGPAWPSAGVIWYAALKVLPGKPSATTFQDLANTTNEIARRLYDDDSKREAVYNAWKDVGIQPHTLKGKEAINLLVNAR